MADFTPKTDWKDGDIPTADDMNRLEQAIYDGGGYSSLKTWADGNEPGVDNWNRLEQGILDIGSDKISANILRGTNTCTELSSTSDWANGTWRSAGGGTGTRESISISDAPVPSIEVGWAITSETNAVTIAQNNIPVTVGDIYTISCYARGNGSLLFQYGNSSGNYVSIRFTVDSDSWEQFSRTFTLDSAQAVNNVTYFFVGLYTTGYMEICGMKMEDADEVSAWSPAPQDIFTAKEWTAEQSQDNVINAAAFNRWEQGITDMLDYREKYATEETETATPQSIPDDTEDDGNVAAPEAEEIE